MQIIESFYQGKSPDASKNEDRLFVNENFIAVIDGSTSKSGKKIDGKTGGVFAVDFAMEYLANLKADVEGRAAITGLVAGLKQAIEQTGLFVTGEEPPAMVAAIYSHHRKEIWRVGDIAFLLDGRSELNEKGMDELMGGARALFIELAVKQGASLEDIADKDVGRDFILPILSQQHLFANQLGEYGYGVINGTDVPSELITITDVSDVSEIVMASDGYPELFPTLEKSEAALAHILAHDPLLFRLHKSTKGVQKGNASFDDRTYIRFTP